MKQAERSSKESQFKLRKCLTPECKLQFLYPFQANEHAEATGHVVEQTCQAEHPRTKGWCLREENHPGKHAYVGQQYVIYF
jgi:hypothetical protein